MPRSPAPTDKGRQLTPSPRGKPADLPPCKARTDSACGHEPSNQNVAFSFVRRCTDGLFFGGFGTIDSGQDGISTQGLRAALVCVVGAYWERHILCNSGVLAWTPVGKQMGPRIPVRVTPHSSAHPNNTGGRRRRVQRLGPTAFSERAATTKNGKRDEARREGTCSTCALMGEGENPPKGVRESTGGGRIVYFSSFSSKLSHIGVGSFFPLCQERCGD